MNLKDRLTEDLKEALKNKYELKLSVIRMAKAAIKNAEIDKRRELREEEIEEVIVREAKKRKEAIVEYKKAGREDLYSKEEKELHILMGYLPEQLSLEEIKRIVEATLASFLPEEKVDIGKVMAKIMPKVKGKADGKLVNQLVREAFLE